MTAEQGTVAWLQERQGNITCSRLLDVVGKSFSYARQLSEERTNPKTPKVYASEPASLAWGRLNESKAIAAYEMERDVDVEPVGFVKHPLLERFGGSADGIVPGGMIEVKNPYDQGYHSLSLVTGWHKRELQELQIQGLMEVLDLDWCDWISYDARLEPLPTAMIVYRRERDRVMWTEKIEPAIRWFDHWVESEQFRDGLDLLEGKLPVLF